MAVFDKSSLKFFLSGGSTNSSAIQSLGGEISNHPIVMQVTSLLAVITGVNIINALENTPGVGTLTWSPPNLFWKPPRISSSFGIPITSSGTYTLGGSSAGYSGYIEVSITYSNLASGYKTENVTVSNSISNFFDTVSPLESLNGIIEYRCFYLKNVHATSDFVNSRLWIKTQPFVGSVSIALDPAGIGDGSTTGVAYFIVDEFDSSNILSSLLFTNSSSHNTGLSLPTLTPGSCLPVWEKRVIPPYTSSTYSSISAEIVVSGVV